MSDPGQAPDADDRLSISGRIDRLSDQFERDWQAALGGDGPRPRIEDRLVQGPRAREEKLFRELLEIELELRQEAGEAPELAKYRVRFSQWSDAVEAAFRRVVKLRRLGDYELLEPLGQGGMGVVYRARHVMLGQQVAMKVLPDHYLECPQALSRFQREMRSIGALKHPNIVQAHNAGEYEGKQFLVMEFVDGMTLDELVRRRGRLPLGAACEAVRQAALGLEHVHEHGLVHRDVKPSNLMLDRSGTIKLLDLGLARLEEVRRQAADPASQPMITENGMTLGTVDYMAPEQCEEPQRVDIRADLYSLGCTLFHLLCGRPPYGGGQYDTRRKKLMAHVVAAVPSLAEHCPGCPDELDKILSHMLAKEPDDRFDTPVEVAEAVGAFADAGQLRRMVDEFDRSESTVKTGPEPSMQQTGKVEPKRSASRPGWPAERRKWRGSRWVWVAVAAVAFAGVAGLVAPLLWPGGEQTLPVRAADGSGLAAVTLPGLSGRWWFEESPWLIPELRMHLAGAPLADGSGGKLDVTSPDVRGLRDRLGAEFERYVGGLEKTDPSRARLVNGLIFDIDRAEVEPAEAGALAKRVGQLDDQHLTALVEHRLGLAGAGDSYERAIADYQSRLAGDDRAAQVAGGLYALCLADLGLWQFDRALYRESAKNFQQARKVAGALGAEVPLFEIVCLCRQGLALRKLARSRQDWDAVDRCMEEAFRLTERHLDDDHPLRAYLHERRGWALMDQWRVGEARQDFEAALALRRASVDSGYAPDPGVAEVSALHNEHGLAMSERFRGNAEEARGHYTALRGRILAKIEGSGGAPDADLLERLVNTTERLADTYLFMRDPDAEEAASLLEEACEYARMLDPVTSTSGDPAMVRAQLLAKRALAAALRGRADELASYRTELDALALSEEQAAVVRPFREAADAMAQLADPGGDPAEARSRLRSLVRSSISESAAGGAASARGLRRETLEFLLFVWGRLVEGVLDERGNAALPAELADDLALVFELRPAEIRDRAVLGFLRPYYDLALVAEIEAASSLSGVELLRHVRTATTGKAFPWVPRAPVLTFYVPEEGHGHALLYVPEHGLETFPLEVGRSEIERAGPGSLALPGPLATRLEGLGEPVETIWEDQAACPFLLPCGGAR